MKNPASIGTKSIIHEKYIFLAVILNFYYFYKYIITFSEGFMKNAIFIFCLLTAFLLINGCAIFSGASVLAASNQIDRSELSADNAAFEQDTGIRLVVVKRGLWSMQNSFRNNTINKYFLSLLDNNLTYSFNNNQNELVRQIIHDEKINIIANNQFSFFSDYEKSILLIASTSTLALMSDAGYNQNNVPNMFFNFINSYDAADIPGIVNSQWYKNRNITITTDGILIN